MHSFVVATRQSLSVLFSLIAKLAGSASTCVSRLWRCLQLFCRQVCGGIGLLLLPVWVCAAQSPLIFGVLPTLTPKVLIETYRPVAEALQLRLGRPVEIYTAPDFKHFVARTRRGMFDLLLTAPHLAWLARQDSGYRPLLKYTNPVYGILVVKSSSSLTTPQQLLNKRIATANPLAAIVMAMKEQLEAEGLIPGSNVEMLDAQSHNNAAMQAYNGVTDAAILNAQAFRQLPAEVQKNLRVIAATRPLSSHVYLTHPRIRDAEAVAIRDALLSYAATADGQAFLRHGGFGGLSKLDGRELRSFKPYVLQAQQILKEVR